MDENKKMEILMKVGTNTIKKMLEGMIIVGEMNFVIKTDNVERICRELVELSKNSREEVMALIKELLEQEAHEKLTQYMNTYIG